MGSGRIRLELTALTHAHLTVEHFIQQIQANPAPRPNRDVRPQWLTDFVERIAELFEPLSPTGRVGFDCRWSEDFWQLEMYLGRTELVGGMFDGESRHLNFQFDLRKLVDEFRTIDEFRWLAFPEANPPETERPASHLVLCGTVGDSPLRLTLFEASPPTSGPALRQFPDGRFEPA
jgi:hypothetical protein